MPSHHHTPEKPWNAIAAMAENRVIGNRGQIPWNLPEDMKWVMQCTRGQVIVMGRATYESMGKPLPNRQNIVLSRSVKEIPGCTVLTSLRDVEHCDTGDREIWIFGGARIYQDAMDRVSDLYLTLVYGSFEGDTFFPPFEDRFDLHETLARHDSFEIRHYVPQSGIAK